ncbi:MAG: ion transporter [Spirochaetales bacterium]|nr:ion transporter [Leptospiraceae bacterium]MCP5481743.1 ion transporter [Spirochaetales bacterium]
MIHVSKAQQDHLPKVIEYAILFAIVLVIVFTVIEELAIIYHWSHDLRVQLVWIAFAFDVLFSAEFIARAIITARHGHFWYYMRAQRGWVDLLASIPLLLLVSGPALLSQLHVLTSGGDVSELMGFISVLKTAKAIRVTRILRLIRVVKLFGKIQNTESAMTNRHVGTIATIMVVTLIVVLVLSQFVPALHIGDRNDNLRIRKLALTELLTTNGQGAPSAEWMRAYMAGNPDYQDVIRLVGPQGELVYEASDLQELSWTAYNGWSGPEGPFIALGETGFQCQLSYHPADADHARLNLFILVAIIVMLGALMSLYTGIFAQQIADPIFIMDKGLRQWEYNLEVRIHPDHQSDEIMHLARAFNDRWLPVKNQIRAFRKGKNEGGERSSLSLDDVL